MKFEPIVTKHQLDALDQDLIVRGYRAGAHEVYQDTFEQIFGARA